MMSSGAATQEVTASVEEVNASVQTLASETAKNRGDAEAIKLHEANYRNPHEIHLLK